MLWIRRLWSSLSERRNRLWVTPAVTSVVAVLLALAGAWVNRVVPEGTFPDIERSTLDNLLAVVSSSMLAVTTFSLSIMVSAFASAASSATPRATELVMGDEGTRTAIAMFLSAFIYAVVAQVALGLGYYGSTGRFVLFLGTVAVLLLLLITLIRWVRTLSSLGRMANTLTKIESAAGEALRNYWRAPLLGAQAAPAQGECRGLPVCATRVDYVRQLDMVGVQAWAESHQARVHLCARPGSFVRPGSALAWVELEQGPSAAAADGGGGEPNWDTLMDAIITGPERNFDQDPRFGLIVLSETAQRALSPAVNDPGTAIDVMNRSARILIDSQRSDRGGAAAATSEPRYDRVTMSALDEPALVFDAFGPIARDGAGTLEVMLRMQRLLAMVAEASLAGSVARAARAMAQQALERGQQALDMEFDREALTAEHRRLFG